MTDISVIKMIISVAVWRIYPSWVNEKLWAWEGLGHSGMFWARLSRDDFRSKLEIISFRSRVMFISKSFFVSRAFVKFGAKRSRPGAFGFDDVLELFWKLRLVTGHFLANSDYDHEYFLKISILFSKQSRCYLPDSYGDPQAEQSSLVVVRRKLEWKLDFRAFARSSAEGPPIVVAFSTSRCGDPKETKARWSQPVITLYRLQKPARKPASFEEPVSETRCLYIPFCYSLFSCMWLYSNTLVRMQIRDSEEKQSSVTLPVLITEP